MNISVRQPVKILTHNTRMTRYTPKMLQDTVDTLFPNQALNSVVERSYQRPHGGPITMSPRFQNPSVVPTVRPDLKINLKKQHQTGV